MNAQCWHSPGPTVLYIHTYILYRFTSSGSVTLFLLTVYVAEAGCIRPTTTRPRVHCRPTARHWHRVLPRAPRTNRFLDPIKRDGQMPLHALHSLPVCRAATRRGTRCADTRVTESTPLASYTPQGTSAAGCSAHAFCRCTRYTQRDETLKNKYHFKTISQIHCQFSPRHASFSVRVPCAYVINNAV